MPPRSLPRPRHAAALAVLLLWSVTLGVVATAPAPGRSPPVTDLSWWFAGDQNEQGPSEATGDGDRPASSPIDAVRSRLRPSIPAVLAWGIGVAISAGRLLVVALVAARVAASPGRRPTGRAPPLASAVV
ncbi:MAG: hypothetical protein ACRD0A_16025 [Acidimicrobiales bacterium]